MIQTADVRVDYDDVTAVRDLNLSIPAGEVFGLIGPNGAGKTSLIRVLATLLQPTYGAVRIGGIDAEEHPAQVRELLGYMPDMAPVRDDLRCWEFLDQFAGAYGVPRRQRRDRIEEVIAKVKLESKRNAKAGTLSRGMKQRLVLAKTLLSDPTVLLLDEPASGIDPIGRIEMRRILIAEAKAGKTVLISSHILTELSAFCTSIGIMERGRLKISGPVSEIIAGMNLVRRFIIELLERPKRDGEWLREHPRVQEVTHERDHITLSFDGDDEEAAALLRQMVERDLPVKAFYERKMDVEDILLQIGAEEVS